MHVTYIMMCMYMYREVIEKRPEEFKIHCLKQIQAIFPEGFNPLHAGFGNRHNVSQQACNMYVTCDMHVTCRTSSHT